MNTRRDFSRGNGLDGRGGACGRMHADGFRLCGNGDKDGWKRMFSLNLWRQGGLGELVHGEGAYIHDLSCADYAPERLGERHGCGYYDYWRLRWNEAHKGNQDPTHGLGPVCQYMNINRGDRMDYLVSLESNHYNMEAYADEAFPKDSWQAKAKVEMGDMNTTLVKTVKGRSITARLSSCWLPGGRRIRGERKGRLTVRSSAGACGARWRRLRRGWRRRASRR